MPEVIVALDHPTGDLALGLVDRLDGLRWVKVGSVLFTREGPSLIEKLKGHGLKIFLDLKWHDIPSTVARAVRSAVDLGVDMVTVHSLGGSAMIAAAASNKGKLKLVAVTVLTSHGETDLRDLFGRDVVLADEVARLTSVAIDAGADGVVCSPHEIVRVSKRVGTDGLVVVPGIRLEGQDTDDQQRVADPATTVERGATHLVIGRPVTRAENPDEVFQLILGKI